jgi:glycosyltransferase involved in cell wall biosynthesis
MREGDQVPSIVIPAHDEERSIAALLAALAPLSGDTEVIVACNGCRDRTVDVVRSAAAWATVLDLPEPSKPAALDAGDRAATSFPRLYLDADVRIDADAVRLLFAAIEGGLPAAAATPRYDTTGAGLVVRSHQRFWERMPTNRQGLAGTNAMAVSAQGRARFTDWPRLIGDDYFLDGLFEDAEKTRVPGATVVRPTSTGFVDCISRKARIHQGNLDIRAAGLRRSHSGGGAGGLGSVLRADPAAVVDLPAHLAVTIATRVLSWWRRRRGTAAIWFRDNSRTKA